MRIPWLVLLALALAGCGGGKPAPAPSGARVDGRGFSVTLPRGYRVVEDARFAPVRDAGGLVLSTDPAAAGVDAIAASIVVVPVTEPFAEEPSEERACVTLAKGTARQVGATVLGARRVALAVGPVCQYELAEQAAPERGAVGTIVKTTAGAWVVTCNLDLRAPRHREACDAVLSSFRLEPR